MRARMMWMLVIAVAVGMAAACGDSKSSLLPTAPSALSDAANVDASAATAGYTTTGGPKPGNGNGNGNGNSNGNNGGGNGHGNGNGNGNGNGRMPSNTSPAPTSPVPPGKSVVQFEGLIDERGAASLKVNGQQINVTDETVIRHGNRRFELSELNPGDRVHVRASRVVATDAVAAAVTLNAVEIRLQNPGEIGDDATVVVDPNPLVSIAATEANAVESVGKGATFRLTRTGTSTQLANGLTVALAVAGTASAVDFAALPPSVTFAANQAAVDFTVTPVNDGVAEGSEMLVLGVSPGATYEVGSPAAATAYVADEPPPTVTVAATRPTASEEGVRGRIVVQRSGLPSSELIVTLAYSGTAENGVDYAALPTTLKFGVGESMITLTVTAVPNDGADPLETLTVTVVDEPGNGYDPGASFSATVTITGT